MKPPSPLVGFNNNFKHKGDIYHIQTEDSGVKLPHVVTHLFADGGRILKTIKTSYRNIVADPRVSDLVQQMMKEQHKAMIVALRNGEFDPGGTCQVRLPTTGAFAVATSNSHDEGVGVRPAFSVPPSSRVIEECSPAAPQRVDVGALERAAEAVAEEEPLLRPKSDLPPPPPSLLGASVRPHGEYQRVLGAPRRAGPSTRPPAPVQTISVAPVRYAAPRPASIFGVASTPDGLLTPDEIRDRTLDEVIVAYLADDLANLKQP